MVDDSYGCGAWFVLQASRRLAASTLSPTQLLAQCRVAAECNAELDAFVTCFDEEVVHSAEEADRRQQRGQRRGPLDGVPVAVKDNFCMKGARTSAGSQALQDFQSPYDATVVTRLKEAGAVIVGKTTMDEFGMGSMGTGGHGHNTMNPWGEGRAPGGSSGGSAVAVSVRSCLGAVGSDTGGSVRLPASYCGVVGVKPTYGRVSRHGLIAYASSLDCPGILAPTVEDGAIMLEAIAGLDTKDASTIDAPVPAWHQDLPEPSVGSPLAGVRIGLPRAYSVEELTPEANAAWLAAAHTAREMGAEIVDVDLPHTRHALATYYTIATAEASSNLCRYDGVHYGFSHRPGQGDMEDKRDADLYTDTRTHAFGDEVQRRIMVGSFVLSSEAYSAYFDKAQRVRRLIQEELAGVLQRVNSGVDVLLTPTALGGAPLLSATSTQDPVELYLNDVMTVPASLAGLPAVSIPIGLNHEGMPLGLQVIAGAFDEGTAFRVGHCLQKHSTLDA